MLGDLRILDTGDELLLDTERVALQALFNMIRRFSIGYDVELHKRTLERGLLSLIGPEADRGRRRRRAAGAAEHAHAAVEIGGVAGARDPHRRRRRPALRRRRHRGAARGARGRGRRAGVRGRRRVPAGRARPPALRRSTSTTRVIPQEAGLNERAVSFTKGCYVGQETVARLYYRGKPNRHLRGLRLSAPGRARRRAQRSRAASSGGSAASPQSPRLGPIALALVRREAAARRHGRAVGAGAVTRRGRRAAVPLSATAASRAQRIRGSGGGSSASCGRVRMRGEVGRDDPHLVDLVGRDVGAELAGAARRASAPPRCARCERVGSSRGSGPQSTSRPPTSQNASRAAADRVRRRAPAAAARGSPRARRRAARGSSPSRRGAAPQPARRARSAARAAASRIWRSTWREQPLRAPSPPSTNSRSASSSRRR